MHRQNYDFIRAARKIGVLEEINLDILFSNTSEETGFIGCSDCHRSLKYNLHLNGLYAEVGRHPLLHKFKLNGLALRLVASKVTEKHQEHLLMMDEIDDAMQLGKIVRHLKIVDHIPCGKAAKHNLSVFDQFDLTYAGSVTVLDQFGDLSVSCYNHVDYTGYDSTMGDRTYYFNTSRWLKCRDELRQYDYTHDSLDIGKVA